jgi:acyl-CoA thioesterase-1
MRALVVVCVLAAIACGPDPAPRSTAAGAPAPGAPEAPKVPQPTQAPKIVFLGDSLTAGLGLRADQSYPSLIGRKLKERGLDFEIVNAGVSGDTTAGGLRRADWSLEGDVRVLVVALGGNDALRGLPADEMKRNLAGIIERARADQVPVILAGMEAPPNNGPDYTREFREVYRELANEYEVRFVPFLLLGVAGNPALNQADGIHPNARGAAIVADLVWAELEPLLK